MLRNAGIDEFPVHRERRSPKRDTILRPQLTLTGLCPNPANMGFPAEPQALELAGQVTLKALETNPYRLANP